MPRQSEVRVIKTDYASAVRSRVSEILSVLPACMLLALAESSFSVAVMFLGFGIALTLAGAFVIGVPLIIVGAALTAVGFAKELGCFRWCDISIYTIEQRVSEEREKSRRELSRTPVVASVVAQSAVVPTAALTDEAVGQPAAKQPRGHWSFFARGNKPLAAKVSAVDSVDEVHLEKPIAKQSRGLGSFFRSIFFINNGGKAPESVSAYSDPLPLPSSSPVSPT